MKDTSPVFFVKIDFYVAEICLQSGGPMAKNHCIVIKKENLSELINEAMRDELVVAKGKWRNFLNRDQEALVLKASKEQLVAKVRATTKDLSWEISDNEIRVFPVRNLDVPPLSSDVYLPEEAKSRDINLLEVNEGWKLDNSSDVKLIPLFKFEKVVVQKVLSWARTAVFYGVSSF